MLKTSAHLPWFKFFVNDFLARTTGLTNEEVGMYIKLMSYSWSNGPLPNNPAVIASIVGGDASVVIQRFFQEGENGRLFDSRLNELRDEAIDMHESASERGKRGGQARAEKARRDGAGKFTSAPKSGAQTAQQTPASATFLDQRSQTNTESDTESDSDANTKEDVQKDALALRFAPSSAEATDGAPVAQLSTPIRQTSNWTERPPFGAAPPSQRDAGSAGHSILFRTVRQPNGAWLQDDLYARLQAKYPDADVFDAARGVAQDSLSSPFDGGVQLVVDAIKARIENSTGVEGRQAA